MEIKEGIIEDKTIQGIKFEHKVIKPKGKANARTLTPITKPIYIVVHNTANTSPTAGADNHAIYMQNIENADKTYLSWHFTVDESKIIQHLPLTEHGWHSGDGNGKGNKNGIAIEIAENKNYKKCEENAIKLIVELMNEFKVPIDRIQPHRYFAASKKLCPRNILKSEKTWKSDWKAFQSRIQSTKNAQDKPTKDNATNTTTKPTTGNTPFKVGDTVTLNGYLYIDSYGGGRGKKYTNHKVKISRIVDTSRKAPYLLGDSLGWAKAEDIGITAKPSAPSSKMIKVGSKVRFGGGYHHATANSASHVGGYRNACDAKVTYIAKGSKHPYHIVGKQVYGWVDADTIKLM